jgi:hypothetical protein
MDTFFGGLASSVANADAGQLARLGIHLLVCDKSGDAAAASTQYKKLKTQLGDKLAGAE